MRNISLFIMLFMSLNIFAGNFMIKTNTSLKLILNNSISQFSTEDVQTKAGTFSTLTAEGYGFSEIIGNPNLPVLKKLIEVPLDAKFDIHILDQSFKEYDLKDFNIRYPLMPTQAPIFKNIKDPGQVKFAYNATPYLTNEFYKNQLVTVTPVGLMRGVAIARLEISPVEYNPVTKKIRVYENLEIEIVYSGVNIGQTLEMKNKNYSPFFEGTYHTLANYKPVSPDALITASPVTYVIVSHIMFHDALQPFIQWKTKKGFKVIEAYTNDPLVGNTTTSIKNYLHGLYDNPPAGYNPPSFLLIVGDVAQVPTFNGTAGSHVTDLYYCEYSGDKIPEVFYGRFSASTIAQLQPQIDKTLEYEQYLMPDPSFLGKDVMIAGVDPTYAPTYGNGQINYGTNYYFNAAHGLLSHTYLYPQSGSSSALIIQNVSNGAAYVNYTAHGSPDGWADPEFSIADIASLQNAHKYPLMVGNCCLTSKFEINCFGEELLRAANKGAIGYIGASNNSTWDEDYWWGCGFKTVVLNPTYNAAHLGAYDVTFHDQGQPNTAWYVTQGQMVVGGNMAVEESNSTMKTYYWEIYCLMGDPSLSVYFSVPQPVTANYSSALLVGMSTFTVNTEENAYVALSMNGVLLDAGIADATGVVNLSFTPISAPGLADIVITNQNRQPHIAQITVAPAEGPYMSLDSYTITDASGNNNGQADYGENILLNVKLNNVGIEKANNVRGILSSLDTSITITNAEFIFGDVAAGSSAVGNNAYAVKVGDFITDQHKVLCNLEITDSSHTWNSTLILNLNAPLLSVGNTITISDPSGNGNGRLDPGETVDILITTSNIGHSNALNTSGSISTTSPYLTLNSTSFEFNTLVPSQVATATFNITASADAPIGSAVDIDYESTSLFNYNAGNIFLVKVGLILDDFESGGFANFSWTQGGNKPWTITNIDPFEGIYSAKSGMIAADQKSTLSLQLNVTNNDSISFFVKTSSESGYDLLKFYIDSESVGDWSGETPWTKAVFPVNAGEHTFKWEYMKDGSLSSGSDCGWIDYIVFPTSAPGTLSVSGVVTYAGTTSSGTPLSSLTIKLKNSGDEVVGTTTTSGAGNYTFTAVSPGNYTLDVTTTKEWGGVTAADILLYRKHIANISLLTGIYLASGDINATGSLTAADVLLIKKRIAFITNSFPTGDWLFNNTPIIVGGGSVTKNFKGLTYGDANGSYIPAGNKSLENNHHGQIMIESVAAVNDEVKVPVRISDIPDLGSFQFTIQYDPGKVTFREVTGWYSGIEGVTIGTPAPGLITFVWAADVKGITIGDVVLCNLHFKPLTDEGSALEFASVPTLQEFSDFESVIFEPDTINGAVKSTMGMNEIEQSQLMIYPNPVSGQAIITYSIPSAIDVSIKILNLLGQEVKTLLHTHDQKAGLYNITLNVSGFAPGIYYCKLNVNDKAVGKKLIISK
ncbi:MAG: C25 family cysteine peptidase [Bacteroidota bacterium]